MPLADALAGFKTTLISLLTVQENYPKNITEFASKWADAYFLYAFQGLGVLAGAPVDASRKAVLETALQAIPPISTDSTAVANAFQTGITNFWLGMLFTTPGFAVTPGTPVTATLAASLTAIFSVLSPDGTQKAKDIADVLHAVTMTTTMTFIGPPPIVDPIT